MTLTSGRHTISYVAYLTTEGKITESGAVSEEVTLRNTGARPLPFDMEPSEEDFGDCIVLDVNDDGKTWTYSSQEGAFQYAYGSQSADDWVFLPPVNFGAKGGAFDLSVDAKCEANYCPESFEICVGREAKPESMTSMMACTNITNTIWDTYTGKITLEEGGNWVIGIHATSDGDMWNLYVGNVHVEGAPDVTPAPAEIKSLDFDGRQGAVVVTLPLFTVEGKPMTSPVGLVVTVDGVEYTQVEPSEPGTEVTVPMELPIGTHTVSVATYVEENGDRLMGSSVTRTFKVTNPEGYAYPLPFLMEPTAGEFEILTIVDANGDGNTWTYNTTDKALNYTFSEGTAADEWVFFPGVAIDDASRIYNISIEARAYTEMYPEAFEMCIGREAAPESMTTVLVREDDLASFLYTPFVATYIAPEAGNYIVGIHAVSAETGHTLRVRNLKVEDSGFSARAPQACDGLTAEADPTGALSATISFRMPLLDILGGELPADEQLTATVTSPTGETQSVEGIPGSLQSVVIGAREGNNLFTVSVSAVTTGEGEPAEVSVFCGIDKPSAPEVTWTVGEDNLSMTLTWSDPAKGINGGVVVPDGLTHTVYVPVDESGTYWNKLGELPAGTDTYTFEVSPAVLQSISYVGISATNEKGESQLGLAYGILGTPYPLPLAEDFSAATVAYQPLVPELPDSYYTGNWFLDDPALLIPTIEEGNGDALLCFRLEEGDTCRYGRIALPKFTTVGASARVCASFRYYASALAPTVEIYADTYDARDIKVGEIVGGGSGEWITAGFDLPQSLIGHPWVNLRLRILFDENISVPGVFVLGGYTLESIYEKQLTARLSAPASMTVGTEYTFTGKIFNGGTEAVALPEVRCTLVAADGTTTVLTPDATPDDATLGAHETAQYAYTLVPTADMIGGYVLRFELADFTDEVPDDNADEKDMEITTGGLPVVTDLTAALSGKEGVSLAWSEPAMHLTGVDDIESYEPFTYAENIGEWLNIDGDGKSIYSVGFNYEGSGLPKGFQVFNSDLLGLSTNLTPNSGSQFFLAVTPADGTAADDWLISPEVIGGTDLSFSFNILSEDYGAEYIDILYSTTGRDTKDFQLLKTFSKGLCGWITLSLTLPEDAKYFAFHYRTEDVFGICLDDIIYSPVTDARIKSYNVYRDGEVLATEVLSTEYNDADAGRGSHSYNVSVVTEAAGVETEHPLSNTVFMLVTGIDTTVRAGRIDVKSRAIVVSGMEGLSLNIYSTDGVRMAYRPSLDASETIDLQPGVYLVEVGGKTVKLVVK